MPFVSIYSIHPRTNPWNFHEKILRIGGAGKWHFFGFWLLGFSKKNVLFFPNENQLGFHMRYHLHISAVWMVSSESWKILHPNYYAHDCTFKMNRNKQEIPLSNLHRLEFRMKSHGFLIASLQVILYQINIFCHQLTQNMTTACSEIQNLQN